MAEQPFGFLNINKPPGMTSHDVVAQVRRRLKRDVGKVKVGHAGTLDPMATGVLVICLGHATRLSEYVMHTTKRYQARIHLGVVTDTYDAEGEVTQTRDNGHIQREDVKHALKAFRGEIRQIPPMYSAIKKGGRKLYEIARSGETIEREARAVTIESLSFIDWSPPQFMLDVQCSSGTYIRSLAHDIGEVLGVGAHLAALTRSASGNFTLETAICLDDWLSLPEWADAVLSPRAVLTDWPTLMLDDEQAGEIRQGRWLPRPVESHDTLAAAYTADDRLLAVLEARENFWKPHKVFLRET